MQLNWGLEATLGSISLVINIIVLIGTIYHFSKERHRHVPFIMLNSLGLTLWVLFRTLGIIFVDATFIKLGIYSFLLTAFSTMLFVDSITRDSVDSKKMVILCILTTAFALVSMNPNAIHFEEFPDDTLRAVYTTEFMAVVVALVLTVGVVFVYIMVTMHINAPSSMKRHTRLGLVSGISLGIIIPSAMILGLRDHFPGIIMISEAIGLIPWVYAIINQPKVASILPFKVFRLTILDTQGGKPLFGHTWVKQDEIADDALYLGMLQGIGMILDESVKKGAVREINLEDAVILMDKNTQYHVACVLLASKSTQTLRYALENFADEFFEEYSGFFDLIGDLDKFSGASELVEEHFAFVSDYG